MPQAEFSLLRKTTRTRYLKPYLFFAEHKIPCHLHTCVAALSWAPHTLHSEWISILLRSDEILLLSDHLLAELILNEFWSGPSHANVFWYKNVMVTPLTNRRFDSNAAHHFPLTKGKDVKHLVHLADSFTKTSLQWHQHHHLIPRSPY